MKNRLYYESLSPQQLSDAALDASKEGQHVPELLAVLARTIDDMDFEIHALTVEVEGYREKASPASDFDPLT